MIKKWSEFNESIDLGISTGKKINAKMNLLKDLVLDLSDLGLHIDIWNGTWKDSDSKSIIMMIKDEDSILDNDNYYEEELQNKPEILELEETFKSFKIKVNKKTGFSDTVYFYFSKKEDSDVIKDYL